MNDDLNRGGLQDKTTVPTTVVTDRELIVTDYGVAAYLMAQGCCLKNVRTQVKPGTDEFIYVKFVFDATEMTLQASRSYDNGGKVTAKAMYFALRKAKKLVGDALNEYKRNRR